MLAKKSPTDRRFLLVSQIKSPDRVSVWAAISGQLIPVAARDRHDPDGWPEQIRPAVAFAMGLLTELEEHAGVWAGAYDRVRLDDVVAAATPGIPFRLTFPPADRGPRRI